jgi:hypothetical protein
LLSCVIRDATNEFGFSSLPVKALDLIGQHDTLQRKTFGQPDFEGISLDLACDGAEDSEADLAIVCSGGQHKGRAAPGRLMSRLGIHGDPNRVASIWDLGHGLPDLVTLRRTGVDLSMEVALADSTQEVFEGRRGGSSRLKDQLALLKAKLNRTVVTEADFGGERLGDPNRQAVPPSLNSCLH